MDYFMYRLHLSSVCRLRGLRVLYLSLFFPLTVLLSVCPPRGANPLDHRDNSFSRSRSSSVTSIDKEAREAISSFHFSETYARKGDGAPTPCLYVGTSLGTVLALAITMPPAGEQRQLQPVIISPTGAYPRRKGGAERWWECYDFLDAVVKFIFVNQSYLFRNSGFKGLMCEI